MNYFKLISELKKNKLYVFSLRYVENPRIGNDLNCQNYMSM